LSPVIQFKRNLKMMFGKLKILLLMLATVAIFGQSPCQNQNPVCGSNGRTYSNECSAQRRFVDIECQGQCPCSQKDFPEKIVISSTGVTANVHGNILGEYTYDSQKGHYVQSFFEGGVAHLDLERKYLYRNDDYDEWQLGPVSGGDDVWLVNANPSQTIPDDSNWEVYDGENYIVDPDLKVTKGGLTPCPGVKIYGLGPVVEVETEGDSLLDIYEVIPAMWNGHSMYKGRKNNLVLIMNDDGIWQVDGAGIKGLPGRLCPSESNEWVYWDNDSNQYRTADIVVKSL